MEVIDIVNENLEFVRRAVRGEVLRDNEYMKFVHVWIVKNNKILIQKRSYSRKWAPGKWATHTGIVAAAEDEDVCASRELKEEIGIDIDITMDDLEFILKGESFKGMGFIFFVNIGEEDIVIDNEEVIDYKYVDISTIENMLENDEFIYYYGQNSKEYFKRVFEKLTTMMEG